MTRGGGGGGERTGSEALDYIALHSFSGTMKIYQVFIALTGLLAINWADSDSDTASGEFIEQPIQTKAALKSDQSSPDEFQNDLYPEEEETGNENADSKPSKGFLDGEKPEGQANEDRHDQGQTQPESNDQIEAVTGDDESNFYQTAMPPTVDSEEKEHTSQTAEEQINHPVATHQSNGLFNDSYPEGEKQYSTNQKSEDDLHSQTGEEQPLPEQNRESSSHADTEQAPNQTPQDNSKLQAEEGQSQLQANHTTATHHTNGLFNESYAEGEKQQSTNQKSQDDSDLQAEIEHPLPVQSQESFHANTEQAKTDEPAQKINKSVETGKSTNFQLMLNSTVVFQKVAKSILN